MKQILKTLYEHQTLDKKQAHQLLVDIASNAYHEIQVSAFMNVFMMRGITLCELLGFREALMELCIHIDLEDRKCMDIVGTGGDEKNTFNISTLSCFVVAAAGVKICKHGNYAASSVSGSSNVMEQLGYKFNADVSKIKSELDSCGITFLHAPLFHPALKAVSNIRKNLGLRTFFNLLGPLVNPASPAYCMIGVYHLQIMRLYQYALQEILDTQKKYMLVHSLDGYDEISLTADAKIITSDMERIYTRRELSSLQVQASDIDGGKTISDAARIFIDVLTNKAQPAQKEVVLVNSAFALVLAGITNNWYEAKQIAYEMIDSQKAYEVFKRLVARQAS